VLELKRISIGSFNLDLESGKWRYLSEQEEKMLITDLN
jgi:23S rRNA pseudouridine2605 synthase